MPETPLPRTGVRARRRRRHERGQSMVEFALTAPILILILVGLVELGNGLNAYLTIVASARDGARLSSQGEAPPEAVIAMIAHQTERLVEGGIDNRLSGACQDSQTQGICITMADMQGTPSVATTVRVCYDHPLLLRLPILFPDSIKMCSSTAMRLLE